MAKHAARREGGAQSWTGDIVKAALSVHLCEVARSCELLAPYLENECVTAPRPE